MAAARLSTISTRLRRICVGVAFDAATGASSVARASVSRTASATAFSPPIPRWGRCTCGPCNPGRSASMALGFVRPATPDDAVEIAHVQLSTWRHAYRRILPRGVVEGLDETWMAHRWRTSIEDAPSPRHRVLVAVEQAEQA